MDECTTLLLAMLRRLRSLELESVINTLVTGDISAAAFRRLGDLKVGPLCRLDLLLEQEGGFAWA